ncbi:F-box only protein 21-like [Epargyreus clarus]|uniref:F-box only protein 21-like n=1 Tax=Epargyreus clarus TaxID=520877 RepID=UPI003C30D250
MDVQGVQNIISINCLPDEIVILILHNNSSREILNFGATCKHYNYMVKNHSYLWKNKCEATYPTIISKVIKEYYRGSWLHEMKVYSKLKQRLQSELIAMSPKHYWAVSERSMDNVKSFFNIATKKNFFYAVHILQDVIKTGSKLIDRKECTKPYTLTEMYYSKAVLRQFIHTYLAVKWVKSKMEQDLPPEVVINFFLQWIDPANLYLDDEVDEKINNLVEMVRKVMENDKQTPKKQCSAKQIILAVSHVIYKQKRMALTSTTDLDTLNISKVIDNNCGNVIVVATIYQAVASRCGASCELIVFPNHLFLEWNDHNIPQLYNIDLATGEMHPKRCCPFGFTQNNRATKYSYCPDSLLQYIYSSYLITMGAIRSWNTQNAMHLLDFLGTENERTLFKYNPYENHYTYLMKQATALVQCDILDLKQLSEDHIRLMMSLVNLNKNLEVPTKNKIAKRHVSNVKFAVGMICYHKRYDYVCIIRGWDLTGCQLHFPLDDLYFGRNQPFYYITAADQSERYVAQENLMELIRPTRLYHLEHQISRDFTHFDGFAYVLNDEKKAEYPEDEPIIEMFRTLCEQKINNA